MKNLNSLALCAVMAPALAFATGAAFAQQSQPSMEEEAERQGAEDRGSRTMGGDSFLASKPVSGFHADELIGSDVRAQADDEEVGTISDLIIDEDGQVVAVIVGVGGFLGMGEKDVAIGWDALQRTANDDGDGYEYRVNATKDSLTDASEYTDD